MLAHEDARAPSWATCADGAGDCPLRSLTEGAVSRGGLVRCARAEGEAYRLQLLTSRYTSSAVMGDTH